MRKTYYTFVNLNKLDNVNIQYVLERVEFERDNYSSDRRPETKKELKEKLIGSDREGLGIGLGIIDRRSEPVNFGAC